MADPTTHPGIYSRIGQRSAPMAVQTSGLGLGHLLLALDRTMVTLVEAPRGLDMPVGSVALVDADDVRLRLPLRPPSAAPFFPLRGFPRHAAPRLGDPT